ncbi:MAG TPA: 50S ribosomal protein L29 [Turneriella sp.]|nr:50S ribosomal protein L29 [Turneriella sp.]
MAKADKKKATKKIDFAELTDAELMRHHGDFRRELQEIRFGMVTASFTNNARVGSLKKDIARILTVLSQRQQKGKASKVAGKV